MTNYIFRYLGCPRSSLPSVTAFLALLIPCMKMILHKYQNLCRDVAVLRLYIHIHTYFNSATPLFSLSCLNKHILWAS
ncbi:hypothetical protein [Nostoc sp.]|uniref:hypothetical protein n=1 Tax=Nostoc sp. TaxID=1180 RepID=UPI002FF95FD9